MQNKCAYLNEIHCLNTYLKQIFHEYYRFYFSDSIEEVLSKGFDNSEKTQFLKEKINVLGAG